MKTDTQEKFTRNYRLRICDVVRIIIVKKNYSQNDLAEIMNVNRSTISKIENLIFNYSSKISWFLDNKLQLNETKTINL